MKIGKYEFVAGPNWQWYAIAIGTTMLSIHIKSLWPVLIWILFNILMIPLSIILYKWDVKQGKKMLRDFSYDLEIQRKYKRYNDA